jgi:hypothetical protein
MLKAKKRAVNTCQLQNKFSRATNLDEVLLLVKPSLVPESAEVKHKHHNSFSPSCSWQAAMQTGDLALRATNSLLSSTGSCHLRAADADSPWRIQLVKARQQVLRARLSHAER